jgi:hypothetical protein
MTKAATLSLAGGLVGSLIPSVAWAHFTLDYPPSFTVDSDSSGTPQKAFPCGVLSTDTYTPSNMVTMFSPGQKITVKWTEQIAHDGWFRIALSYKDGAAFQATTDFPEPTYSTNAFNFSVDAGIESPPVAPVLMDGIDPHTAASITTPKPYAQEITLPTMPCQKCTLQVIQIMLNHPVNPPNNVPGAGYTYHHCAFISIQPGGDGGTQIVPDSGGGGMMGGSGSSSGTASAGGATTGSSTGSASGSSGTAGATSGSAGGTGGKSGGAGGTGGPSSGEGATGGVASNGGSGGNSGGGCSASLGSVPRATGLAGLALVAALALARRKTAKPS